MPIERTDWFSLKCPYCRHRVAVHSGPDTIGQPGECGQAAPRNDGTWTPCDCPGWWTDGHGTVIDNTAPQLPLEVTT